MAGSMVASSAALAAVRTPNSAAAVPPLLPRVRSLFVATPAWHAELVVPQPDAWSVPFFLHRHARAHHGRERLAADSIVYVGLFVDHKTLTAEANRLSEQWLRNGSSVLPLLPTLGGHASPRSIDLASALAEGRVWTSAYGPQRCDTLHGSSLHTARIVFFDRAFGSCDEARGIMAPAHGAAAAAAMASETGSRAMEPPEWYAAHDGFRNELFFYGRICKPYIDWPNSSVRYRLWKALRRVHEAGGGPRIVAEGVDVTLTVAPYSTADERARCAHCSYACKTCYVDAHASSYRDAPHLSNEAFGEMMRQSEWCVVARGDDPQTPKLAEALLSLCLPAIVIDGRLPFEDRFNYSAAGVRVPIGVALEAPGTLLEAVRATSAAQREAMRDYLRANRHLFEYGRTDSGGAEAAVFEGVFERTPIGATAVEAEAEARAMPGGHELAESALARVWNAGLRVEEALGGAPLGPS